MYYPDLHSLLFPYRLEIIDFLRENYDHLYVNLPPSQKHLSKVAWGNLVELVKGLGYQYDLPAIKRHIKEWIKGVKTLIGNKFAKTGRGNKNAFKK